MASGFDNDNYFSKIKTASARRVNTAETTESFPPPIKDYSSSNEEKTFSFADLSDYVKAMQDVSTAKESTPKKPIPEKKKSSPLENALKDVDGPILKLFLVRRHVFVIGWFEYIDESFRQLMVYNRFRSSGEINLYARENPAMSEDTILLPGIRKDSDTKHIEISFRSVEDAERGLQAYLNAFEELAALVRGRKVSEKDLSTKFSVSYVHIF